MDEEQIEEPQEQVSHEVKTPPAEDKNWKEAARVMAEQRKENERLRQELERAKAPKEIEEDAYNPDDYLSAKQLEKLAEKKARKIIDEELRVRDARTDEQLFLARNPDCEEVLKKYLPKLAEENPWIKRIAQQGDLEAAYGLVKNSWQYQQDNATESAKAKKILKNTSEPVSANAAGGSLKNKVESFTAGMTREQIWAKAQEYQQAGGR